MTRPWSIRLAFAACLAVLLAAMAAVSVTTLRLDREQMQAAQRAEVEENVRLALWRMDSLLTSIMVEESARPPSAWESFSGREPAFTKGYTPIKPGDVLTPSPLLAYSSSNVLLHFQLSLDGQLTSPQVPLGAERRPAFMNGTTTEHIEVAETRLDGLRALLELPWTESLAGGTGLQRAGTAGRNRDLLIQGGAFRSNSVGPFTGTGGVLVATGPAAGAQQGSYPWDRNSLQWQENRNDTEWQARNIFSMSAPAQVATNVFNKRSARSQQAQSAAPSASQTTSPLSTGNRPPLGAPTTTAAAIPSPAWEFSGDGVFKPLWLGQELVLTRGVSYADRSVVQGVWLSWTNVRQMLLAAVGDLFPVAEIRPMLTERPDRQARRLAAIPAQLVIAPGPAPSLPAWSPVRTALVVAWLCGLLAAVAVAVLLHGTVSLSERRAAFVSAVTHELRTPLTTFRMYSEMLAEGMVPEATQRQSYLATLCAEANRLSHLVENVLAYARLERGSARSRVERVSLGQLIERVKPRLDQRAAQADLSVVLDSAERALATQVHVDASAVEQILFNLVDNACKYAAPTATERLIHLEAWPDGKFAMIRVRDHGQGISAEGAKRLFQPFSKSAHDAAHSAPGVGLGLALCRRLSRSMGGDLRLDALPKGGACFVLSLPLSEAGLTRPEATIA